MSYKALSKIYASTSSDIFLSGSLAWVPDYVTKPVTLDERSSVSKDEAQGYEYWRTIIDVRRYRMVQQ